MTWEPWAIGVAAFLAGYTAGWHRGVLRWPFLPSSLARPTFQKAPENGAPPLTKAEKKVLDEGAERFKAYLRQEHPNLSSVELESAVLEAKKHAEILRRGVRAR